MRNLCIDELRRNRLPTTELTDGDRAGAGEDVYSTLSRRHELRRLIEDLADLPEQQRAALLMRELDGLSHDEVADALDISPAASRQLVKRARTGLIAAAEARDADCAAIRDVLLTAHDERRRPSEHALRHLKTCGACREFRDNLKATRSRLRALVPPIGMGPLAGVLHLIGGGAAATSKVAVTAGCCAVLAAGGAAVAWQAGERHVVRGDRARAPRPAARRSSASRSARARSCRRTSRSPTSPSSCRPATAQAQAPVARVHVPGRDARRGPRDPAHAGRQGRAPASCGCTRLSRADYKYWRRTGQEPPHAR